MTIHTCRERGWGLRCGVEQVAAYLSFGEKIGSSCNVRGKVSVLVPGPRSGEKGKGGQERST
jgi:hypothetical protein